MLRITCQRCLGGSVSSSFVLTVTDLPLSATSYFKPTSLLCREWGEREEGFSVQIQN